MKQTNAIYSSNNIIDKNLETTVDLINEQREEQVNAGEEIRALNVMVWSE